MMQSNDVVEYSTSSSDANERVMARRKRMEQRHSVKTEGGAAVGAWLDHVQRV